MKYKREYRLEIAKPLLKVEGYVGKIDTDITSYKQASNMITEMASDSSALVITDLDITFRSSKTASPSLNECTIVIKNISKDTEEYLSNSATNEIFVKLEAGYKNSPLTLIAVGAVQEIKGSFRGNAKDVTLVVSDGYTQVKEARSSISFKKGVPYKDVLNALIHDLGLPEGQVDNISEKLPRSLAYTGSTWEGLKQVAGILGYTPSIQNFTVHFVKRRGGGLKNISVISPSTGLIGSPSPLDGSSGVLIKDTESTKKGVKFSTLIDGAITPNTIISLQSASYYGTYKVLKTTHEGDYEGTSWYVVVEAEETDVDLTSSQQADFSGYTIKAVGD